jgi:hypothetical protein
MLGKVSGGRAAWGDCRDRDGGRRPPLRPRQAGRRMMVGTAGCGRRIYLSIGPRRLHRIVWTRVADQPRVTASAFHPIVSYCADGLSAVDGSIVNESQRRVPARYHAPRRKNGHRLERRSERLRFRRLSAPSRGAGADRHLCGCAGVRAPLGDPRQGPGGPPTCPADGTGEQLGAHDPGDQGAQARARRARTFVRRAMTASPRWRVLVRRQPEGRNRLCRFSFATTTSTRPSAS